MNKTQKEKYKEQAKNMTRDGLEEYWIQNQYADYLKSKEQEND